uniref:G-protein coupled receptors family 1 profile domain-containing protein n=1 Tax=Cynoglossus semilaevis TaxID=244447 RepID=A0A3P8VZQ7_CYNSE
MSSDGNVNGLGKNITFARPAYFIISGFIGIPNVIYYYVFLCIVYIVSVLGNTVVMTVIYLDRSLRTPKYIAVFNLAFVDLFGSTVLVPKVLDLFLFNHRLISYNDCLTFLFFCYLYLSLEVFNLMTLSYDRLIAITFPLHYPVMVTNRFMFSLITSFWLFVITVNLTAVGLLTRLSFCNSNTVLVNSYFCDHGVIYREACNDQTPSYIYGFLVSTLFLWFPLCFILVSYLCIGYALSKVASAKERAKALKTCTAHLSLVAIYFVPIMITFTLGRYIHPNSRIINMSLASAVSPMLNPIIYVLQTQEIKKSVKTLLMIKTRQFKGGIRRVLSK